MAQPNSNSDCTLIWLQLFFVDDNTAHSLCIAEDLSSFGYFQRVSVREHLVFTSRTASSRCEKESRVTIILNEIPYTLHLYKRADGLSCAAITDNKYSSYVVQSSIISKLLQQFDEQYTVSSMNIQKDIQLKFDYINQLLTDYSKISFQKLQKLQNAKEVDQSLNEINHIMHKNLDDLLCRGEKLDNLIAQSDDISTISKQFMSKAKKTNQIANIMSIESQLAEISNMMSSLSSIVSEQQECITQCSDNIDSNSLNSTIGFSVGGSNDVNNFRKCIDYNIMPHAESITFNGLLHEYYFDITTDINEIYDQKIDYNDPSMLFYPSYCYAKSKSITCDMDELFMTVGLNSNVRMSDFKRKKLNLVLVVDKSGSMSDCFDNERQQYYQQFNDNNENMNTIKTKMEVANESVLCLLQHLNDEDQFGMIVFDERAQCIQSLQLWKDINYNKLKKNILNIQANGGTNFEKGYCDAIKLYEKYLKGEYCSNEYENRIIVLSDACPNEGVTDPYSLLNMVKANANNCKQRIYTTFIGVGLDFNSRLIETVSQTRGCNYMSVQSSDDFMCTMDKQFEYIVTPLVFNVCLKLNCEGKNRCYIDKVYGSGFDEEKNIIENGEIMRIHTLFPSIKSVDSGEIQGGIQLIKLKSDNVCDINDKMCVYIEVTFEDRNGKCYKNEQFVQLTNGCNKRNEDSNVNGDMFEQKNDMIEDDECDDEIVIKDNIDEYYDNKGIRKGILLCRYVELIKEWIEYDTCNFTQNNKLMVSQKYKNKFDKFLKYYKNEMKKCEDNTLKKEIDVLNKLIFDAPVCVDNKSNITMVTEQVGGYFYGLYQGIKQKIGM